MLADATFDVCFHSSLARAARTAEVIWDSRKQPTISVNDLREIDLYSFEGLTDAEAEERFPQEYKVWQNDPSNFLLDGHYPVRELWTRAQKCWSQILSWAGNSILVVAHNGINQALIGTAIGLGPEYYNVLKQSNCNVSVVDFTPKDGGMHACLDRLNQTRDAPTEEKESASRIIFVTHGATEDGSVLAMLGVVQTRKTAESLLDVKAGSILCSSEPAGIAMAEGIAELQKAADVLGVDSAPRNVEVTQLKVLDGIKISSDNLWERSESALDKAISKAKEEPNVIVVASELVVIAMLCHWLGLGRSSVASFHLTSASLSFVNYPAKTVRCINYTAHLGRWAEPVTFK